MLSQIHKFTYHLTLKQFSEIYVRNRVNTYRWKSDEQQQKKNFIVQEVYL